jgi:hypothetical protein
LSHEKVPRTRRIRSDSRHAHGGDLTRGHGGGSAGSLLRHCWHCEGQEARAERVHAIGVGRVASTSRMLGVTFQLALLKHPNRPWLSTASPNLWPLRLDYVFGEDVFLMKFNGLAPPWTLIIAYELQIRKLAVKYIQFDDKDLATAMREAAKNVECRERHFVSAFNCRIATACVAPAALAAAPHRPPVDAWTEAFEEVQERRSRQRRRQRSQGQGPRKDPDSRWPANLL